VVTIDYALNDRAIGLKRAEAAWRWMITQALQQHMKVILLTPTPDLKANLNDPEDPLNQLAEQIRRLPTSTALVWPTAWLDLRHMQPRVDSLRN
jgi:hypothetical protein